MDNRLKKDLKQIYAAPEPLRKNEFIRKIPESENTFMNFLWLQAGYIRKWNWVMAGLFFLGALWGTRILEGEAIWMISGCTPFLALTTVTEGNRSVMYGMEELELSARFSMKSVILARLGVLGVVNALLLSVLFPIVCIWGQADIYYGSVCVFLPYLLNAFLNLFIVRKVHVRESQYICVGITILVSVMYFILSRVQYMIFMLLDYWVWGAFMAVLAVLIGIECRKYLQDKEEYGWSL